MICGDDRPCPTVAFFNEEAIGGRVQGDAAGDSFANRSNRTSAAAISCLFLCGDDAASSVQRPLPCPTLSCFNEEAIGGLAQGAAACDIFWASAGYCVSANRAELHVRSRHPLDLKVEAP